MTQQTITPGDSKSINSIFEERKQLFIQLCEGKISEQECMMKDDEKVSELRDIIEIYQPEQ